MESKRMEDTYHDSNNKTKNQSCPYEYQIKLQSKDYCWPKKRYFRIQSANCNTIGQALKRHFIMIKGTLHYEDTEITSMFISNNRSSKCMKQKLLELRQEIVKSTISQIRMVTPCSLQRTDYRTEYQQDVELLKNTVKWDLTAIYRTLHQAKLKHTLFSSAQGTSTKSMCSLTTSWALKSI